MAKSIKQLKEELRVTTLSLENAKKAKYRVKNSDGKYEVIHLETSADQVITTGEKQFVSATEKATYLDKYSKSEIDNKVREINGNIATLEANDAEHLSKISALENTDKEIKSSVTAVDLKVDGIKEELEELINNGGSALDEYKTANDARVEALENGKAEKEHKHEIADVNGLRDELNTLETKENVSSAIEAAKEEVKEYADDINGTLVEAIEEAKTELETKKVNKTDIVNTLDVAVEGKVLDARQGKALKELVDQKASTLALESGLAGKADKSHRHSYTEIDGLGSAATKEVGNLEGQLVALGADNKIDAALLPSIAINETFVVDTKEEAMEKTVEVGDIVIVNNPVEVLAKTRSTKNSEVGAITYIVVKADAESFEEKFRPLMSGADNITKGEVLDALSKKLDVSVYTSDKSEMQSQIASKADAATTYNKTEVDGKVDAVSGEVTRVEGKFDTAVESINSAIAEKMDAATVEEKLASKADKSYVEGELTKKADEATVNSALALKAEKTYVDETMATKAEVIDKLAGKADTATVNEELAKKADKETTNAALALKADAAVVYTKVEVDKMLSANAPSASKEEPVEKAEGHIWLELL